MNNGIRIAFVLLLLVLLLLILFSPDDSSINIISTDTDESSELPPLKELKEGEGKAEQEKLSKLSIPQDEDQIKEIIRGISDEKIRNNVIMNSPVVAEYAYQVQDILKDVIDNNPDIVSMEDSERQKIMKPTIADVMFHMSKLPDIGDVLMKAAIQDLIKQPKYAHIAEIIPTREEEEDDEEGGEMEMETEDRDEEESKNEKEMRLRAQTEEEGGKIS